MSPFRALHDRLLAAYGPQHWWPAATSFEVMVGAVLTQNTAWANVEQAIARLRGAGCLSLEAILHQRPEELAALIRPAGYFNIKAQRLQALCRFLWEAGGESALGCRTTADLRRSLLGVQGIGPETADDILLYALGRPVFVVDAYTRRLGERLGLLPPGLDYEAIRARVEADLGPSVPLCNELHALIVRHGKDLCRPRPRCRICCLAGDCPSRAGG